jgi:hypothetical protein
MFNKRSVEVETMPQLIAIAFTAALLWAMFYLAPLQPTRHSSPAGTTTLPGSLPRRAVQVVALLTDNNTALIGYLPVAAVTHASSGIATVDPAAYGTIVLELLRDDPAVLAILERWCRSRATVSFRETESGRTVEMRELTSSTRLVLSGPRRR